MEALPTQLLPVVPHIVIGIFDFAIPNIFSWVAVFAFVLLAAWIRLPGIFEPEG
jgi:hypothetical protein